MKKIVICFITILLISCQKTNKKAEHVNNNKPIDVTISKVSEINDFGKQVKGHYSKEEDSWISEDAFYESASFD